MVPDQVFSCPPGRFRQVGGGVGEMTSRISSPGPRLEACPNQRDSLWRSTDVSARRLQRWRRVEHRTWSQRLHRQCHRNGVREEVTTREDW